MSSTLVMPASAPPAMSTVEMLSQMLCSAAARRLNATATAALRSILTNYAILSVISAAIVFGFIFITGILGEKVRYDLRRKLFDHLQRLSFSYFDKTAVGWIMSRVTSDTERIADLVTWGLLDVTWGLTSVLVASAFMLAICFAQVVLNSS